MKKNTRLGTAKWGLVGGVGYQIANGKRKEIVGRLNLGQDYTKRETGR